MATPGFVSYSVDNDKIFARAVDRALKGATDLRIPFTLIASDFYRSQKAIWKLNGPGLYPDLSKAYKLRKQKVFGFAYPILKATGRLETAASVQGGPGNVTRITATSLEMGVDDKTIPYAIFHQSDAPRKRIPLRKFLFIGPEAPQFASTEQKGRLERWLGIMNGYLTQTLNQSGMGKVTR